MNQEPEPTARRESLNLLRWAPVAGSVILMVMVAFIATGTMSELRSATNRREHTLQEILTAHSYEDNLINIQNGMSDFVTLGDADGLALCQRSIRVEPQLFNQLATLTRDNSAQQERLKALSAAVKEVFTYDGVLTDIYRRGGAEAVLRAEETGEGRTIIGRARGILKAFYAEEEKLLEARDAAEQADYRSAEHQLILGSVIAAVLFALANFMAGRELRSRRRAESRLVELLTLQSAVFNSASSAIVTTDKNGVVQSFNAAAERILGYAAKEVVGKTTPMLWRDPREIAERATKLSHRLGHPVRPTFETVMAKIELDQIDQGEWTFVRKDGTRFPVALAVTALAGPDGNLTGYLSFFQDISERKHYEAEREKLVIELREALTRVKTLSGLIPICAWCKSIRSDTGYWQNVEVYVRDHSEASFSHGICPSCQEKFKDEIAKAAAGAEIPPQRT
jgi:PAS domain-containing protein